MSLFKSVADLLVVNSCFSCGRQCSEILCEQCVSALLFIKRPFCSKCGYPTLVLVDSCRQCRPKRFKFTKGRSLLAYEGVAKEAIVRMKSESAFALADFLVKKALSDFDDEFFEIEAVTFIPATLSKRLNRRHNVSEVIARTIAHHKKIDCVDMLALSRRVKDQAALGSKDRQRNLDGAFRIMNGVNQSSGSILVVDDIFTTGATLNEACKVLAGAKIETKVFTLARGVS